jgi:HAD superfamily hydrolase (TIGR01509 family)
MNGLHKNPPKRIAHVLPPTHKKTQNTQLKTTKYILQNSQQYATSVNKYRTVNLLRIKAVVFDLDGTIVDFKLDYKASRAEIIQLLRDEGFPQSLFSVKDNLFEILNKAEIFLKNHHKTSHVNKVKRAIFSVAEKYEMEAAHATSLIPGIREVLKTLKEEMKLRLALFTVNGRNSVNHILQTFNLKRYFDAIVTRDDVSMVKPNPVHLKAALDALRVKPKETIVVGDSVWDMKSAQAVRVFAVGITTGIASSRELANAGAHCIVTSPTDIITLIEQLNKKEVKKRF